jgi:hypothetical protein
VRVKGVRVLRDSQAGRLGVELGCIKAFSRSP